MADQLAEIEIGFVIRDHPHFGYRKEDRIDLEHAHSTDILQGAFMGDAILRLPGEDFSTSPSDLGWRGLVEWCLRLDAVVRRVAEGASEFELSVPDISETIQIRRDGDDLLFSFAYVETVGRIGTVTFIEHVEAFIRESTTWIGDRYPAAKRNPAARAYWERLDAYLVS
ncbi:hypothetical protein [Promicromonospora sp. NPDC023987]|uniref:hypothetical protein n=1 Tax=Promicromonospora sp. NPDC023987 TaxID=3155360 RepID=UPI003401DE98